MPSKKKSPYGGTLSQPHITPSPPSKVGTKIEGTFFGFFDFQRNYFQSFTLYFIKTSQNGFQVAENMKTGKS